MSRKPLRYKTCPACSHKTYNEYVPPTHCRGCGVEFWHYFSGAIKETTSLKRWKEKPQRRNFQGAAIEDSVVLSAAALGYTVVGAAYRGSATPVVRKKKGGKSFIFDPLGQDSYSAFLQDRLKIKVTLEPTFFGRKVVATMGEEKKTIKCKKKDCQASLRRKLVVELAAIHQQNVMECNL